MMAEAMALDSHAAVALVAAAAASIEPDRALNPSAWERVVTERAETLLRIVPLLVERSAVLASCQPVTGVIVKVEEVKGRGVITAHATMGTPQANQEVVNGRAVEQFRTAWLNEPAGRALFDQARSLIGHHCRFGKRTEQIDASKKVRMVEWIEDMGADPDAAGQAQSPRQTQPTAAPQGGEDPWFVANGWRDKAQHDAARKAITETLTDPDMRQGVIEAWKEWANTYAASKGFSLKAAWPSDAAIRLKAKLIELQDEEEARQLALVGGGEWEYPPGGEPF